MPPSPPQEGFVFKKPQRPGQRSRLPPGDGAAGTDALAQRPSSAPDLLVRGAGGAPGGALGLGGLRGWGLLLQGLLSRDLWLRPPRLPWRPEDVGAGGAGGCWDTPSPNRAGVGLAPLLSRGPCPPQFDTPEKENVSEGESPIVLRRCSLTSSMSEEEDDGFMEILDEEEMKVGRAPPPGGGLGLGGRWAWGRSLPGRGRKQPGGLGPFTLSSSSPPWPSRLLPRQSDADVPQGMENLLTAPLVRTEEAEPVRGSLGGWMVPQAPPWGP